MTPKPGTKRYADHALVRYVRSLNGQFYLAREVCELLDCAGSTLINLPRRSGLPLGPTHQVRYGGITLHLYTPQRIEAIAEYLKEFRKPRNGRRSGPDTMWTRAEQTQRWRARNRLYNYRHRAEQYTAAGDDANATRMLQQADTVNAELQRSRLNRWKKVHGTPYGKPK
jgi:hypothetical protein